LDYFPRNLLKIKRIALKSARPEQRQNRVTYNNTPFAKLEKRGFLTMSVFKIPESWEGSLFGPFVREGRSARTAGRSCEVLIPRV
jgi:hypothetical protein